jgi:DNA-binding NarL/FixJ family response regulator
VAGRPCRQPGRDLSQPSHLQIDPDSLFQAEVEQNSVFDRLTPREREVLQLIAEGHTNKAIAQILQISVKTVEKHRANLMSALNVHDLAGLVRIAIDHGLVFPDQ